MSQLGSFSYSINGSSSRQKSDSIHEFPLSVFTCDDLPAGLLIVLEVLLDIGDLCDNLDKG